MSTNPQSSFLVRSLEPKYMQSSTLVTTQDWVTDILSAPAPPKPYSETQHYFRPNQQTNIGFFVEYISCNKLTFVNKTKFVFFYTGLSCWFISTYWSFLWGLKSAKFVSLPGINWRHGVLAPRGRSWLAKDRISMDFEPLEHLYIDAI